MIGGKNILIAQVYGPTSALDHPKGMRLAGSAGLKTCLDLDGLGLPSPRIPAVSQDSERWRKCFLHCEGFAGPHPEKGVLRPLVIKRHISLLAFVPLTHKTSDAPDDLVMVEWWVILGVGASVVDIMPHIRPEKF